ncbi:MAG: hypothetical protein RLZZ367_774 [Bacteroidota bacterium]
MKTNNLLIISALFLTQMFSSCKKEVIETTTPKTYIPTAASIEATATDKTYTNTLVYKTVLIAFGAGMGNLNVFKNEESYSSCATITIDSSTSPKHVTIDFGSSGCSLDDGTPVTGVITGTYNDQNLGNLNSKATLDLSNFYIDGNHILGTFDIQNKTVALGGNYFYDITVTGGNVIFGSDGRIVKNDVSWLVEWDRNNTNTREDDSFNFTGTSSGVTSGGDAYTETITSPLVMSRASSCVRQFISGVSELTINNQPNMTIDYGNGDCDSRAEIIQDGITTRIVLRSY